MGRPELPPSAVDPDAGTGCRRFALDRSLLRLSAEELEFFKTQTDIESEQALLDHVHQVASETYQLFPYPCIRWYIFTQLGISSNPAYKHVLAQKADDASIFVDIGVGFGTDLRKLVSDGFPADKTVAFDIRPSFWEFGHHLFKSTPKSLPAQFVQGDVFDLEPYLASTDHCPSDTEPAAAPLAKLTSLAPLVGRATAIHASFFFHLFSEDEQCRAAQIFGRLLARRPGAVILGRHRALPVAGLDDSAYTRGSGRPMFCHSPTSWRELWRGILGDAIEVTAELTPVPLGPGAPEKILSGGDGGHYERTPKGSRYMIWSVRLL